MNRTFDYKVILIIFLSITLYLLYRNIEKIEKRVKLLENKNEPKKNPIQLPLPEPLLETEDDIPEKSQNVNFEEFVDKENVDTVKIDFKIDKIIEEDDVNEEDNNNEEDNVNEEDDVNEEDNVNEEENINEEDNTLEEFSNEMEEIEEDNVQIYSNDNEDELESSLMESLVEAVDDTNDKLNSLLKNNKLPELQQKAEELNINLIKENLKKKTKLELAKEILSKNN